MEDAADEQPARKRAKTEDDDEVNWEVEEQQWHTDTLEGNYITPPTSTLVQCGYAVQDRQCTNQASALCVNALCRKHCKVLMFELQLGSERTDVVFCAHCDRWRDKDGMRRKDRGNRSAGPNYRHHRQRGNTA